jgi:hypothetical protein
MAWYVVPSLDPALQVTVGWEPVLGSFVSRVEGVPTGALLDPERPTVAWFGSRQAELQTVQDLQEAIGEYAVLGSDLRAALEADRAGPTDLPRAAQDRSSAVGPNTSTSPRSRGRPIPRPAQRCSSWPCWWESWW